MLATLTSRSRRLRVALVLPGLLSLTLGLVLLPGAQRSLAAASAGQARGGGSVVTVKGPHMWNPNANKPYAQQSTVTVSQSKDLANQSVRVSWTGFTPTNFEGSPPYSNTSTAYPVMLAECKGTHPTIGQCYGAANEGQYATYSKYGPFNTAFEATISKGTGWGVIDLETISQNLSLGCETGHPCSLLVMPAQGGNISKDNSTSAPFTCQNHSDDVDGNTADGARDFGGDDVACSWADRIVVPLYFAPTASACPKSAAGLSVVGSPMMNAAMTRWDSGLCSRSDPISVTYYNSVPEPEGITQVLGGLANVALTSQPSTTGTTSGKRQYTYAPVGVSAVDIGYWADNSTTTYPQTSLKLNPELVAKLVTLSYNLENVSCKGDGGYKGCDPGIGADNPQDFYTDPEFQKLNPHLVPNGESNQFPAVPIVMGSPSDMTYALTRWIAANPAAKAFVGGKPDKWGMRVNKYYKAEQLPTNTFASDDPSNYMTNAFAPQLALSTVTNDLVLSAPPGEQYYSSCLPGVTNCNTTFTQEPQGNRALYAVMDSGDTSNFQVPTAAIENHAGRYVLPTPASMAAALQSMVTAKGGVTQQVNLNSNNPRAYPLTMVVYAMVPTSGVGQTEGALIARWLRYLVGSAQDPGELPGKLAPGYLPLPQNLRNETLAVADKVQAQTPAPSGSTSTPPTSSTTSPASTPSTSPSASGSLSPSPSSSIALPKATPKLSTVAVRDPLGSGLTRFALPVLLIVGGLAALGGASSLIASSSGGAALVTRLRRAYRAGTKLRRKP
jgi:hypothetical protein